jgi:2-dehydropantoate 2-reductase
MTGTSTIYVVGAGSIGMPLAALLSARGASVVAVRTSREGIASTIVEPTVELADGQAITARVEMVSLSELENMDGGIVALTAKATANAAIAQKLKRLSPELPLVLMQNGVHVERPFLDAGFTNLYRCVLYATGQPAPADEGYRFREVAESPIGAVNGDPDTARALAAQLTTPGFRFRYEADIKRQVWKKAIVNAAFNSICPLANVDNGVFHRDPTLAAMAETILTEAGEVAARLGIMFAEGELMEQLLLISRRADGQLISTLQDLNQGKETEIEFLNLEIARVGASLTPPVDTPVTRALGELIAKRSRQTRGA